ncbi:MAG: hypothetical protein EXR71_14465 [Myxococcales bacterium]|nr:hypothetical protein [Myxococcales bacterium]
MILLALACASADGIADTASGASESMVATAVVATTSADYASAVLATVELATMAVTDRITTAPTDSQVVSEDGRVYVLGRFGADYVRVYQPGEWTEPLQEFSTGDATNPQDVKECGGSVFVSLYGSTEVKRYDPDTWLLRGVVDLGPLADSDGIPEVANMIERDGILYVALQQLDQDNGWVANGGLVASIDCTTGLLRESWIASPDPTLHDVPGSAKLLVRTGLYFAHDGALAWFEPATGVGEALVTEADLGLEITDLAMVDATHGVLLTYAENQDFTVWCWNAGDNTLVELFTTPSSLHGVKAVGTDVWLVARAGWAQYTSPTGLIVVDAVACEPGAERWTSDFAFPPFSVDFY